MNKINQPFIYYNIWGKNPWSFLWIFLLSLLDKIVKQFSPTGMFTNQVEVFPVLVRVIHAKNILVLLSTSRRQSPSPPTSVSSSTSLLESESSRLYFPYSRSTSPSWLSWWPPSSQECGGCQAWQGLTNEFILMLIYIIGYGYILRFIK